MGLGLPFRLAEEMKTKYGNAMPSEEGGDDVTVTENGHSVSYHDLCEIIEARVEELLRLILFQMPQTNYAEVFPSGLVLTGGGCNLPGIAELGREITQLPVKIGTSLNLDGSNDSLCDPVYATSVGLLYWKMRNKGSQDWQTNRGGLSALLPRWSNYFISRK
jgi:cell division protein FtsA